MLYTTNILASPLLAALWVLDTYLNLIFLRLFLSYVPTAWARQIRQWLDPITDPVPRWMGKKLSVYRRQSIPIWLLWLGTIVVLMALRHLVIGCLVGLS